MFVREKFVKMKKCLLKWGQVFKMRNICVKMRKCL